MASNADGPVAAATAPGREEHAGEGTSGGAQQEADDGRRQQAVVHDSSKDASLEQGGGGYLDLPASARTGFYAQYFAVGLISGGLPATFYGFFLGYLNVPAYVHDTVTALALLPWSFKFLFGLVNDTLPIRGQRRRPYMVIGWAFCAAMLVTMALAPLPAPYWCIGADGYYKKEERLADGTNQPAKPCNPSAKEAGGKFAFLAMFATLGYVVADVAADGLTVEYAKLEPIKTRGSTQTSVYFARTVGEAVAQLFVGICMNGKLYNGSFSWGLRFNEVCACLAVPAFCMIPLSMFFVQEPPGKGSTKTFGDYLGMSWELLKSRALLYVIMYSFLSSAIGEVRTTAGALVKQEWAHVQNFQNQMFSMVGSLAFAASLWLVKRHFLNVSWRLMIAVTQVLLQLLDAPLTTLTIFGVVRNQYFYLGEKVLFNIPFAANFLMSTFVVVEMADEGNEGLVYGLLTTSYNLGTPLATAVGKQIYGAFKPPLSEVNNYIYDAPDFRREVFLSFLLSYGFALASLAVLPLLPNQKADAQRRKRDWTRRQIYGVITLALFSGAMCYSLLANFLSMFPSTMCLRFAGGEGC